MGKVAPVAEQLLQNLSSLDWASEQMFGHLTTIFLAIEKFAAQEPQLAIGLARVGSFITEASVGELDSIGVNLSRSIKEVH